MGLSELARADLARVRKDQVALAKDHERAPKNRMRTCATQSGQGADNMRAMSTTLSKVNLPPVLAAKAEASAEVTKVAAKGSTILDKADDAKAGALLPPVLSNEADAGGIGRSGAKAKAKVKLPVSVHTQGIISTMAIDLEAAGKQTKGKAEVTIFEDKNIKLCLEKFPDGTVPTNPALPAYQVILRGATSDFLNYLRVGNGYSTLSSNSGQIINKGSNVFRFYKSYADSSADKPFRIVEFNLDKANDYEYPARPKPTEASKQLKKEWGRFWKTSSGFDLTPTAKKPLEILDAEAARQLPGPGHLIDFFEKDFDAKLADFKDRLVVAHDPKSGTYAVGEYTDGESDHRLYLFDKDAQFTGFYRVSDDGNREWYEGVKGELGKPS